MQDLASCAWNNWGAFQLRVCKIRRPCCIAPRPEPDWESGKKHTHTHTEICLTWRRHFVRPNCPRARVSFNQATVKGVQGNQTQRLTKVWHHGPFHEAKWWFLNKILFVRNKPKLLCFGMPFVHTLHFSLSLMVFLSDKTNNIICMCNHFVFCPKSKKILVQFVCVRHSWGEQSLPSTVWHNLLRKIPIENRETHFWQFDDKGRISEKNRFNSRESNKFKTQDTDWQTTRQGCHFFFTSNCIFSWSFFCMWFVRFSEIWQLRRQTVQRQSANSQLLRLPVSGEERQSRLVRLMTVLSRKRDVPRTSNSPFCSKISLQSQIRNRRTNQKITFVFLFGGSFLRELDDDLLEAWKDSQSIPNFFGPTKTTGKKETSGVLLVFGKTKHWKKQAVSFQVVGVKVHLSAHNLFLGHVIDIQDCVTGIGNWRIFSQTIVIFRSKHVQACVSV